MKNKRGKRKSYFLRFFVSLQIVCLILGPIQGAEAQVGSIQKGIKDGTWLAIEDILGELGINTETVQNQGQYANVIDLKPNGSVPAVSIMFTPDSPKVGEKMTAVAIASGYAGDTTRLYYTWFLKRKDCDLKVKESQAAGGRSYNTDTAAYDPGTSYPDHDDLNDELEDGAVRSDMDCDMDEDGIMTVNDWKVAAGREIVRGGFTPDISGKYEDLDGFYTIHSDWNESADDDGYQAWQGGADAERMPSHCHAMNQTTGRTSELTRSSYTSGGGGLRYCANGTLPVCGESVEYEIPPDIPTGPNPVEWNYCECEDLDDHTDPVILCEDCTDGDANNPDCVKHGETCVTHDDLDYHVNCEDVYGAEDSTQNACEATDTDPTCSQSGGNWTMSCSGGLVPICPSSATPSPLDRNYLDDMDGEYYGPMGPNGSETEELPTCSCEDLQTINAATVLDTDAARSAMCNQGGDVSDLLLCGSEEIGSGDDQYHLFPWSVSLGSGSSDYYRTTREYQGSSSDDFNYRVDREDDTGNGEFEMDEERFWRTDPRNPSTAGNGQADEANLSGLGIDKFTWTYEEGDEVGVAVEGTSALPTKFNDSSRMIFFAFSVGPDDMEYCQPEPKGDYQPDADDTGTEDPIRINAGFLDFDRCTEHATNSPAAGGSTTGGQATGLEVELDISPDKITNDESGENKGGEATALAIATGSSEGENNLEYSWKIFRMNPAYTIQNNITTKPAEQRWSTDATQICGSGTGTGIDCPFLSVDGNAIKTKGTGMNELNFYSNIALGTADYTSLFNANGDGYLKISVEAKESASETNATSALVGQASAIVKISTAEDNGITVFKLDTDTSSSDTNIEVVDLAQDLYKIIIRDPIPGDQIICDGQSVCQVSPNEIIGLRSPDNTDPNGNGETLDNFQWKKDGRNIDCDENISDECVESSNGDSKASRYTLIPITDAPGKIFSVSVKASNVAGSGGGVTATGRSLELSQKFKVVKPGARIYPSDVDCADNSGGATVHFKEVGAYTDPTGVDPDEADFSQSVLEVDSGLAVDLKACYNPDYIANGVGSESWTVDGESAATPSFTAGASGFVHNVNLTSEYGQSTEIYSILANQYGVSVGNMENQKIAVSAQVEVASGAVASLRKGGRLMASLISRIPGQFLFLIRIFFALLSIIILAGTIFAFFPKMRYDYERQ